jgi:hypothetical protein
MPGKTSASPPTWPRRSASSPASCSPAATLAAAASAPPSQLLNKSASRVGRAMIPCASSSLPPLSAMLLLTQARHDSAAASTETLAQIASPEGLPD